MSYYETLIDKANRCRIAAAQTYGVMSSIWSKKAVELETKAANLPVVDALCERYLSEKHNQ